MKIDFIIGSLRSGGAERVVSTLANHFAEKGYQVRIITFKEGDRYSLNKNIERLRFHNNLPIFNYALARAFVYLIKFYFFKKNRPDIISSHINLMGLVTIPISKLFGIKIIVSEHNNHVASSKIKMTSLLWKYLYPLADAVTILTSYDYPFFSSKNKKVIVLPNPSSFKPYNGQDGSRENSILAIGDLDKYHHKGFDNLIEIAHGVIKERDDWKFVIVGEGDNGLEFLKNKIKEQGLENNIIFTGFRSDVQDIMHKSSIFMLSSRFEGLPMVLIEAASQGMACIAYDCVSGPSEIIDHNINGLLINDQNKEEMVKNTIMLIDNEVMRTTFSSNAPKSVDKFSIEKIGKKWEDLFFSLINNNSKE